MTIDPVAPSVGIFEVTKGTVAPSVEIFEVSWPCCITSGILEMTKGTVASSVKIFEVTIDPVAPHQWESVS